MNIKRLVDNGNAIIELHNERQFDAVSEKLELWIQDFCENAPLPIEGHASALVLASIAAEMEQHDFLFRLRDAAHNVELDNRLRAQTNEIAAMVSNGLKIEARQALLRLVSTEINRTVLMPHSWDVLAALRRIALDIHAEQVLPMIDTRRYETGVFERIGLLDGPHADVKIDGHGAPDFVMRSKGDCPVCEIVVRTGVYEPTSMQVWQALVKHSDMAVDVGSHVGIFSLLAAATKPDMPVHAFEPNPEAFARLTENIQLNGFSNVTTHPVAVSDGPGETVFDYVSKEDGGVREISWVGSTSGRAFDDGTNMRVETQSLDGVLSVPADQKVIMKIDTEGNEAKVFRGMTDLLSNNCPDIILETFRKVACREIREIIEPLGYRAYRLLEGPHVLLELENLSPADLDEFHNLNTLLTTRKQQALRDLLPPPCRIEALGRTGHA